MFHELEDFSRIDFQGHEIVPVVIGAGTTVTTELVATVNDCCDRVEDARSQPCVLFHVCGATTRPTADRQNDTSVHLITKWEQALRRVEKLEALIVCGIQHACTVVGLEILLTTDYRISMHDVQLSPGASAVWPSMWMYRMVNQLGVRHARQMALLGRDLSATDALDLGLVDEVSTDLFASVKAFSAALKSRDIRDISIRRRLLHEAVSLSYENALGNHLAACAREIKYIREKQIHENSISSDLRL